MIDTATKEMYSEVYTILNLLGVEYINKLPSKLYKMIEDSRADSYNKILTMQDLNLRKVKREALSMIALFHLKYWCESDDEKENLKKLFYDNEKKYQEKLREKYNPDNIFKNKYQSMMQQGQPEQKETALIEVKEGIFTRFIKKLKIIFSR